MIEKKFNMLSTREWIQYLQYKLAPEREKEINDYASSDPFLKDALDAMSSQEARPVAFQSISYLIGIVEENTGVSESKITKSPITRGSTPSSSSDSFNPKIILLALAGLLVAGLIGYGIYWAIQQQSSASQVEEVISTADSIATANINYADSSSRPFDVLPSTTTPIDTAPKAVVNPTVSARKPAASIPTTSAPTTTTTQSTSTSTPSVSSTSGKEQELFEKAQALYMQNKRDEAKKILRELKSYDNPKRAQAEKILNQIGN